MRARAPNPLLLLLSAVLTGTALHAREADVPDLSAIRVAVARAPSLQIRGRDLVARTPEGAVVALGAEAELTTAGPFVTEGSTLAASFEVVERSGAELQVQGQGVLGSLHVTAEGGALLAVDRVDVERYVASVVGAEMSPAWPAAALQAQAIAVRTYALSKRLGARAGASFDVEASVLHQVYRGARSLDARTVAAAAATRGLVLVHGNALAHAFFFSSCRGLTESASAAFGSSAAPWLVPVPCDGAEDAPNRSWSRQFPVKEVSRKLAAAGALGDELASVEVTQRTASGRVATVRLRTRNGSRSMSGPELRRLVGYSALPSLDFEVTVSGGRLVFDGGGSGHGVGLCQWCARGLAARGVAAEAILAHFYPGTEIRAMYGDPAPPASDDAPVELAGEPLPGM